MQLATAYNNLSEVLLNQFTRESSINFSESELTLLNDAMMNLKKAISQLISTDEKLSDDDFLPDDL